MTSSIELKWLATKRKDWQMGPHEIKNLLYNKRDGYQIEEAAHRMRESLCHLYI
jgi:hypothetical protein